MESKYENHSQLDHCIVSLMVFSTGHHSVSSLSGHGAAEVIGQAAVCERNIRAFFQEDNLRLLVQAPQPCGTRRSPGNSAYDNDFLLVLFMVYLQSLWHYGNKKRGPVL